MASNLLSPTIMLRTNANIVVLGIFLLIYSTVGFSTVESNCREFMSDVNALSSNSGFTLNWSEIPKHFRLGNSPHDLITVYRGDVSGLERYGMNSTMLDYASENTLFEELARLKTAEGIKEAIEEHTTSSEYTSFVSASLNPKLAQTYARHRSETIYQIKVTADRLILDPQGGGEVLVLRAIRPQEIVAVKIVNDDRSSELWNKRRNATDWLPEPGDRTRKPVDPKNWHAIDHTSPLIEPENQTGRPARARIRSGGPSKIIPS